MERETLSVSLTVGLVIMHLVSTQLVYSCGPSNKCDCYEQKGLITMDCTAKHVGLQDACKAVGNVTEGSVVDLRIGRNNIGPIHASSVKGCEQLVSLDLHSNQLSSLALDTFVGFNSLQHLDIRDNSLDIYEGSFDQHVFPASLLSLYLGGNIPKNKFLHTSAVKLKYPNISRLTSLLTLHMDGFQADFGNEYYDLTIKNLSLSTSIYTICNISVITGSMFSNLRTVERLYLSDCDIRKIDADGFKGLHSLQWLDMSLNKRLGFNALGNVSYGLQFTNIRFLNYSKVHSTFGIGTEILLRDICFLWNTSLESISLNSNRLQILETNVPILLPTTLHTAYINDNNFMFAPFLSQLGCVSNLTRVYANNQNNYHSPRYYLLDPNEEVDRDRSTTYDCPFMSKEFLQQIANHSPDCSYLEKTDFQKIFKPTVPPTIEVVEFRDSHLVGNFSVSYKIRPNNVQLRSVDLSGNVIYSIGGTIGPFPHARRLDLSRNYCTYIGHGLVDELSALETLELQTNELGDFIAGVENKDIFRRLERLKVLNLTSNRIVTIQTEMFKPLGKLEILDLSYNNINTLNFEVNSLVNLLHLNLSYNAVRTVPEDVRKRLLNNAERLKMNFSINLSGNMIACSCDDVELLKWLLDYKSSVQDFEHLVFDNPGKPFTGKDLEENLIKIQKRCRNYTGVIVATSVGVTAFVAVVLGGVIYKNRWKLRYILYMSKQRFYGYRKFNDNTVVENYKHDAFISYAEEDLNFVLDEIIPSLENRDMSLCIHQRDFLAGIPISDNIISAIQQSRKTVVILSRQFLKKKWCMYEFNMARMESIYSRDESGCLVIVKLEEVPAKDMPLEMLEWIQKHSYLEYTTDEQGQVVFWDSLRNVITS